MQTTPANSSLAATPWTGTGKGVRVAVIDSGINPQHSHVRHVAGGTHISLRDDGTLNFDDDWRDLMGHGTAIAGVLRAKAPDCELYSVRVFEKSLQTHAEIVAAAIRWAADHHMQVANCSLGTGNIEHRDLLQEACDYATAKDVLLVASSDAGVRDFFPAGLRGVVAVTGDEACGWDHYYHDEPGGLFRAHPHPRPLPRLPQKFNLQGHSFAGAHIAAWIARIREQCPTAGLSEVIEALAANAVALDLESQTENKN